MRSGSDHAELQRSATHRHAIPPASSARLPVRADEPMPARSQRSPPPGGSPHASTRRNAEYLPTTCCVDFRRRAVVEWRTAAHRTRPRARGGCSELCGQACIGVGLAHEHAVPVRWRCHAWQEGARRPTKLYGVAEVRPSSSDAEQRQTKAAWATEQARAVERSEIRAIGRVLRHCECCQRPGRLVAFACVRRLWCNLTPDPCSHVRLLRHAAD